MKHNWSSLSLVLPSSSKTFRVQNQSNNSSKYPRLHKILLTGYCCLIIVTIEKNILCHVEKFEIKHIFIYMNQISWKHIPRISWNNKSPLFVQIYKFHAYKKHPNGKDHINNMHSVVVYTLRNKLIMVYLIANAWLYNKIKGAFRFSPSAAGSYFAVCTYVKRFTIINTMLTWNWIDFTCPQL